MYEAYSGLAIIVAGLILGFIVGCIIGRNFFGCIYKHMFERAYREKRFITVENGIPFVVSTLESFNDSEDILVNGENGNTHYKGA